MEMILSFVFISMILAQKYSPRKSTEDKGLVAIIVGISYAACTYAAMGSGTLTKTGAAMNPAIALA
jgi:glycerol uptake facilitator-like aquaporin